MDERERIRVREARSFGLPPDSSWHEIGDKALVKNGLTNMYLFGFICLTTAFASVGYLIGLYFPAVNPPSALLVICVFWATKTPGTANFWYEPVTVLIMTSLLVPIAYLVPIVGALFPFLCMCGLIWPLFLLVSLEGRKQYFGEKGLPEIRALKINYNK